ncbi:MAG: hypothetical protein R3Y35_06525 [Clostridia bacterium]
MLYKENWDETLKYLEAFWNKDCLDRCSVSMQVIKDKSKNIDFRKIYSPKERFTNPAIIDEITRSMFGNKLFLGEAIPGKYIDFGTAGQSEYFGCKQEYGDTTIWFNPAIDEPDATLIHADMSCNKGFERQKQMVRDLVSYAKSDYFLAMPDNCGSIDALAELRGTENLLCDMLDDPEFVSEAMPKIIDAWKVSEYAFYDLLKDNNLGGSSHSWMHLWTKGLNVQLQCDFSVMISPALFEEFVLPELQECAKAVDFASYHLDGVEEVRHLDMILSVPEINNIQWTPVAGQPRTSEHIEVFQKIQKAGKGLILGPEVDEVETLLKYLSPKGLKLNLNNVPSEEIAKDILKMAENYAK